METRKLRIRKPINYYEPEEPPRDAYEYCDKCEDFYFEYCSLHGGLLVVPDDKVQSRLQSTATPRAMLTAPAEFLYIHSSSIPGAGWGVFARIALPQGVRFGPYRGQLLQSASTCYSWQISNATGRVSHVVDASDAARSNWMRYVNCARHSHEQNLSAYQFHGQIYYRTTKTISLGNELLVFYGKEFAMKLKIHLGTYNSKLQNIHRQEQSTKSSGSDQNVRPIDMSISSNSSSKAELQRVNTDILGLINFDKYYKNESMKIHESGNSGMDLNSFSASAEAYTSKNNYIDSEPVIEEASMGPNVAENDEQDPNCNVIDGADQESIVANTQDDEQQTDLDDDYEEESNCTESLDSSQATIVVPNRAKTIWQCNVCDKVMSSRDKLRGHKRIHLGVQKFKCKICGYQTNLLSYFRRHAQSHNNAKEARKRNETKPSVRKDARTKSVNKTSWECEDCQTIFSSRANLRSHKRTHGGSYTFKCDSCDYQTDVRYFFERHLKATHRKKPAVLRCLLCDFRNSNVNVFRNHVGLHGNKKSIKCDMCDYLCTSLRYLRAHLLRVHVPTKRYQCAICARAFNCAEYLRKHIKNVHLSRDG